GKDSTQRNFRDIKIVADLPFKFVGYDDLLNANGVRFYYPQTSALDDDYYYILYAAPERYSKRLVVVYDKDNNYIVKFYVGAAGGEGLHIEKENGNRYLYAKNKDMTIGKFDITNLDSSLESTTLEPVVDYEVNFYMNFFKISNGWSVEANNYSKGNFLNRDILIYYNEYFSKINCYLWINPSTSTLWSDNLDEGETNHSTKKQGMTIIENSIFQTVGGYYDGSKNNVYHLQGVQELGPHGNVINDYTYKPEELMSYLESVGKKPYILEHEGAYTFNNRLYSSIVYRGRTHTGAQNQGVLIVEYGGEEKDYTFNESGKPYSTPTVNYNPYK